MLDKEQELYNELIILYEKTINEFISLSRVFNYKSIIELSSLFEYLLIHDYFGPKVDSVKSNPLVLETKEISGVNSLAGGVCRHKSCMLNDIFHKFNIDSTVIVGQSYKNKLDRLDSFDNKKIKKQVGEVAIDDNNYYIIEENGVYLIYPCYHDDDYYEKIDMRLNHAVVIAGDDKKVFIDPTLYDTYYLLGNDEVAAKSRRGNYFFIWHPNSELSRLTFMDPYFMKTFNKIMKMESMDDYDVLLQRKKVKDDLKNSKKILEDFKKYNIECFNEIKDKCLSLRKIYGKN